MSRNGWHDTRSCWATGRNFCFLLKNKKQSIEKQGVIHRHTIAVTETAAGICINQGGFANETVPENTHLQVKNEGCARVLYSPPSPTLSF